MRVQGTGTKGEGAVEAERRRGSRSLEEEEGQAGAEMQPSISQRVEGEVVEERRRGAEVEN